MNASHYQVIVIGAGAAGLMAALTSAERGLRTLLIEKNKQPGVKILMSGGTRCNLTQNTTSRGIIEAYGDQGRFLHSALAVLSPQDLVQFMEAEGVPTKIEDTNKIFPVSNRASDIVEALVRRLHRSGAEMHLSEPVQAMQKNELHGCWTITTNTHSYTAEAVVVTTGGLSYPGSGTTGDGFQWAQGLGHTLVPMRPALTPLTTNAAWMLALSGLTLPMIEVKIKAVSAESLALLPEFAVRNAKKIKSGVIAQQRGSVLFTHFGLSGPAILDISRAVTSHPHPQQLALHVDFLPEINAAEFESQLQQDCARDGKKQLSTLLAKWLPHRLVEALFSLLQLSLDLKAAEFSKAARLKLIQAVKDTVIPLSGALGYKKAEVTAGGIALGEVDSSTMQSKLVPGLYFAGEVLDLDGPIGGYNFQAAFATGRLAGLKVLGG